MRKPLLLAREDNEAKIFAINRMLRRGPPQLEVAMDEKDDSKEEKPLVLIVERRKQRQTELTAAEVMKILRRRAARARKLPAGE